MDVELTRTQLRQAYVLRAEPRRLGGLWDFTKAAKPPAKRQLQMMKDMKDFALREGGKEGRSRQAQKPTDLLGQISATIDFQHHEGTDRRLEMAVVKHVLVRENLLMKCRYYSDQSQVEGKGSK
ncbi:hypothetical protein B484DRAFT_390352, partial [Ochromonadaceae sp. CCMP2298]